jgi:hypothetical protein
MQPRRGYPAFQAGGFENRAGEGNNLFSRRPAETIHHERSESPHHLRLGIHLKPATPPPQARDKPNTGHTARNTVGFRAVLSAKRRPFADAILHEGEPLLGIFKVEECFDKLLLALGWGHGFYHVGWDAEGKSVATGAAISTIGG